jgi:hypothetical protein
MPRSGTTWLAKIFDSHPDTLYRHEPDSRRGLSRVPLVAPVETAAIYEPAVQTFVAELPGLTSTRVAASLPIFPKHYYSAPASWLYQWGFPLAKASTRFVGDFSLPNLVPSRSAEQLSVVWKSIESVGRLGVIVRAAKNCRAILILRHPCGYVASVIRGEAQREFSGTTPSGEDYGVLQMLLETRQARRRGLDLQSLKGMSQEERLTWRWLLFNEKALEETAGLDGCTFVRYEDVCADPQGMARKMLGFTGLEWNRQTEAFVRQSVGRERSGYYSVFKEPLQAANKWRDQLTEDMIRRIFGVLQTSELGRLYQQESASTSLNKGLANFNHQPRGISIT